ncbi:hypothetical protein LSH36_605g00041 [Paralvinella palmiformis]|uniref:AMP-dependent synthetase/ligase domain-containing protein n=1 Tax=Paralvinella palmiformis TaxID=53620 RepID=A0AAD9J5E9_9ANNE|nr:hypothetical protein LSH36_605g00041 [Paralvinella palmiformis]
MAEKSLAVAASLLKLGIKPGDTIAIAAYNSPEWIYIEYACLRIKVLMIRLPINTTNQNTLIPTLRKHGCRALVVDEIVAVKIQSFINEFFRGASTDLKDLKIIFLLNKVPTCLIKSQTIETINGLATTSSDPGNVLTIQNTIDPKMLQ